MMRPAGLFAGCRPHEKGPRVLRKPWVRVWGVSRPPTWLCSQPADEGWPGCAENVSRCDSADEWEVGSPWKSGMAMRRWGQIRLVPALELMRQTPYTTSSPRSMRALQLWVVIPSWRLILQRPRRLAFSIRPVSSLSSSLSAVTLMVQGAWWVPLLHILWSTPAATALSCATAGAAATSAVTSIGMVRWSWITGLQFGTSWSVETHRAQPLAGSSGFSRSAIL